MLTYRTETNWARALTPEEMVKVNAKLAELTAQGKTDGVRYESTMMAPLESITVERHWATEEDAKNWIDFFSDFFPPIWRSQISVIE
jgi:hypothetical protein